MNWAYRAGHLAARFILFCTMRVRVIRPEAPQRAGAYLLACSHLSHLEPFIVSALLARPVDWVTRVEFFKYRIFSRILRALNAFEVRRAGVPVSAIRTAIGRLERGRIVGICPEGGVVQGPASCLRGGPLKRGVCLISYRTGVPVLPCVVLGSDRLTAVGPWLPARRGRLWVAFGDRLIHPPTHLPRKSAREQMARELGAEYVRLFDEVKRTFNIPDAAVP